MSAEELLPLQSSPLNRIHRPYELEIRQRQTAATVPAVRPIVWLNLLCLDAPVVAVVWQELLARTFGVELGWPIRAMLFLTAWLIYLADRWFDCSVLSPAVPRSLRQRFWQKRLPAFGALVILIAFADLVVSWFAIDRTLFISGAVVGAAAVIYLIVNHSFRLWNILPVKECCVGFLFAAGTTVALVRSMIAHRVLVLPVIFAFILFGLVCSLNCISIAVWERDLDLAQGNVSIGTSWPAVRDWLNGFATIIVGVAIMVAMLDPRLILVAVGVGLSAVLLRIVPMLPVSRDGRTALADLVLLTPLLMII